MFFIFRSNQEIKDYKNNILKFQWYLHMNQDSSDQFNETSGSRSGPITCSLVRHSRERLLHTSLILCVFHGERMFERYVWDSQEAIYRRKKKEKRTWHTGFSEAVKKAMVFLLLFRRQSRGQIITRVCVKLLSSIAADNSFLE